MEKAGKSIKELRKDLNELMNDIEGCNKAELLKVSRELDKLIYLSIIEKKDS